MSLISIENLTFGYDGSAENVFENVNIKLDSNWKIGLFGRNGTGKSTLFKLLAGKEEYRGKISASVRFTLYPPAVNDEGKTCGEIAAELTDSWKVYANAEELGLNADVFSRPYNTLSEGEKAKLTLAAMFANDNDFLLIDEPTNHLDAEGRSCAAAFLKRQKGFILITHDRAFADESVDTVVYLSKTKITVQRGNMSSFLEERAAAENAERAQNERLKREIDAIDIAKETITSLSTALQGSMGAFLNREAGRLLSGLTGSIYQSMDVGRKLDIWLNTRDGMVPLESVSSGTMDQVYLALRLAAVRLIEEKEGTLPLLFDDSFVLYDDDRLGHALGFIAENCSGQILIFSCHHREEEVLSKKGHPYNMIRLRK